MTSIDTRPGEPGAQGTKSPGRAWPFTGRADELERVRRSSAAGRPGLVVTGPAGRGKTRLVTEALRGTDHVRAAGTPETRHLPFAAFAHLLPEPVTLHRAVQLLSGARLLLVDDAHLLDDASAALIHQLAVHGRTRLLVVVTDGTAVPEAVSRLWTGELLPRLILDPLPPQETAELLTAAVGAAPEPLTADRLHRLCRGDLRLLRELLGALREQGPFGTDPDTGEWAWRGPVPVTATLRERTAPVLGRSAPKERETLERLAFAEPLPLDLDDLELDVAERLETEGLIQVDDAQGTVRLAHPLHGPVLRATAGRLRARRLTRAPGGCGRALEAETAALVRRVERADVRDAVMPVGEWLVAEGARLPAGDAAVRARFARLRGRLREAAAWAREGLRTSPGDPACRTELALVRAQSGEPVSGGAGPAAVWAAAARGDLAPALAATDLPDAYDAVRLGAPEPAAGRLTGVFAAHADALARRDGPALDRVAGELERRGFLLFAAEAYAQAVRAHRDAGAARTARTRAVGLARRCQGARTPALAGLVLGELTARQRQIVTLAAAGLSNRQIAERLTLSVRTVGNHLYSAYARLGGGDRGALPWLVEPPRTDAAA
ncbi:helix-turn-helix transcriptional regulator [Streptomyces daghestanicus]|uniref:DNA-binding CsgD family transcriptional regulator n=2 Tax=Streptomyces TaxID=1883 RepID=A0ABT9LQ10_STRGD|nr:DNA-binding CsgD family transcriptional regulator [Streptomyces griseoviridis]GGS88834.1 helix-turn-helix transcriptional regulator [Streptomyces griseoviridis]GGU55585.1 helix-turn-helix transcriptional regulator [Streptomyces daghestanicus]GHI34919.1 helix-turn-helix transcriptional regulator [Streptomyces daghestanicus]